MVVFRQKLSIVLGIVVIALETPAWNWLPLQAAIMGALVWPLAGMDAPVTGKTRRLRQVSMEPWVTNDMKARQAGRQTSEKRFPHPIWAH
jgi:hypothetical protein